MSNQVTFRSGLDDLDGSRRIVTIGTFDGIHRGHRELLSRTVERARELGLRSLALTFEPVPASVLRPDRFPGRICAPAEKLRHLAASGVDEVAVLTFDLALSRQTPDEFMALVADRAHVEELWVGEAFALGKDRAGDVPKLREIGRGLGFDVISVPRVTADGEVVSSSAIRSAVMEGNAARARRLLGRPFRVSGEVIHGAHLGRTIGYPTANVAPPDWLVSLADGIYASFAILPDGVGRRPAMTYVGTRPTVNSGARLVETHIFDFSGDIYGQVLDVDICERLRGDATFSGLDELVAQLHRDEQAARAFLGSDAAEELASPVAIDRD
ncbi:MAG TPA: bifunctional riboflavin kinase/FAD synthetase [Thermomicrobiales bacterium]|nr:bifunctional riboflavin kinase/FAD synthetase [Thermomicrobiales bacterium]